MQGLKIKMPKEIPNTHNLGRLVSFYCNKCGRFIVACYETDPLRGGGISQDLRYCSKCANPLNFGEFYCETVVKKPHFNDEELHFDD